MTKRALLILALAVGLAACDASPKSAAGFRLPDGDPVKGQEAFVELKCHACHRVQGLDLPEPTIDPPVPVMLGGEIPHVRTDGDLITSIINPSHKIAPGYKEAGVQRGDFSRMADYSDVMTVRELIDIIAFLHSRYQVVRPGR